ncbi:unnamed protein product [Urochloa humidicola]
MALNDDEEPPPAKPGMARPMHQVLLTKYHNRKAPLAANDQKVVVELKGASSASSRAPLDLVAVIDISGSMEYGGKLENAKKALHFIIRKLSSHDRLSIVQFDHEATRLCPLRCATEATKAELEALVGSLKAGGATNIQAGLETGLDVVKERKSGSGRAANIMLMSDGGQNEGDARKVEPGNVPVHTFGFSSGHDTTLMFAIAEKSLGGVYNFVDDDSSKPSTNLSETFSQILAGLVTIIALDLELTVTPLLDEATINRVDAGSYPLDTATDGSSSVTVRFGTLYCTEARKVIVQLALGDRSTASRSSYDADVAYVQYRFSFGGQQVSSSPERITVHRSRRAPVSAAVAPPQVRSEVARREHADSIKAAMEKADGDKLEEARKILGEALRALERLADADPMVDMLRRELLKLLELFKTKDIYEKQGRPSAMSSVAGHDRQRFTARGDAEEIRIFATRRMDTYLKQAKQPDDRPIPSADDDVQEEPHDLPAAATSMERRTLSVALRVVTTVFSLLAFSIMASARTSAWGTFPFFSRVCVRVCIYMGSLSSKGR